MVSEKENQNTLGEARKCGSSGGFRLCFVSWNQCLPGQFLPPKSVLFHNSRPHIPLFPYFHISIFLS